MCMSIFEKVKMEEPIIGYKVVKNYSSIFAKQKWKHGKMVIAKEPEKVKFAGNVAVDYPAGIHAYTTIEYAQLNCCSTDRIIRVELTGVTHMGKNNFGDGVLRADTAIPTMAFNQNGNEISWGT